MTLWLCVQIETKLPEEVFARNSQVALQDHDMALELSTADHGSVSVPLQLPSTLDAADVPDDSKPKGAGVAWHHVFYMTLEFLLSVSRCGTEGVGAKCTYS